ncbi:putative annexin [Helianthus anomalus]
MATLTVPPVPVSPRDDAIQLHKAFKGFGCDTAAVIGILAHRDATQRACIRQEYETMYSEDIYKRLSSELSGKLETAVLLWMHDPAGRDAVILKQGLTRDFLNLEAVTEIICSRTSTQLLTLTQIYHSTFGSHLEHDIKRQASGDHEKVESLPVFCFTKFHFV